MNPPMTPDKPGVAEALKRIAGEEHEGWPIQKVQERLEWIESELEDEPNRLPYGDGSKPPCRNGHECTELLLERAQLIALSALRPLGTEDREGWVLVPREPTEAMREAGEVGWCAANSRPIPWRARDCYVAMIAAAPSSKGEGK